MDTKSMELGDGESDRWEAGALYGHTYDGGWD